MKEKKNIERLFQENFKDFEVTPDEKNWENIQNRLDKKEKDRKLIPIWFPYAGIAALLLLFFALGGESFFESKSNIPENKIVLETPQEMSGENTSTYSLDNKVVNTTSPDNTSNSDGEETDILEQNSRVVSAEETSTNAYTNNTLFAPQNQNVGNRGVTTNKKKTSSSSENSKIGSNSIGQPNNSIVKKTDSERTNNLLSGKSEVKKNSVTPISNSKNKGQIVLNSNPTDSNDPTIVGQNKNANPEDVTTPLEKNSFLESNLATKNKADESIVKEETELLSEIQKDSLIIEEAIAKTQDKDIDEEEKLVNRWQLYANIAPVYYNTLSEGSHLHEQFVNNPKNGELNTSYGVNVGYALNNKFTVRAGIRSLDLSYSTGNIILYESPGNSSVQSMLRNVSMANDSISHMAVLSSDNFSVREGNSSNLFEGFSGSLTQNISYFEVPVEVEYNLIKKKVGFQVIGGLSTFFLDNNEIYADVQGTKSYIGKANNINNVSFSANFGLGLDYNFSQKFKFNLEPTFKYQLNAYNNTSGNFRPYIIGVYTGFSYKF